MTTDGVIGAGMSCANAMSAPSLSRQLILASLIGAATLLAVVGFAVLDVRAPRDAGIGLTFGGDADGMGINARYAF